MRKNLCTNCIFTHAHLLTTHARGGKKDTRHEPIMHSVAKLHAMRDANVLMPRHSFTSSSSSRSVERCCFCFCCCCRRLPHFPLARASNAIQRQSKVTKKNGSACHRGNRTTTKSIVSSSLVGGEEVGRKEARAEAINIIASERRNTASTSASITTTSLVRNLLRRTSSRKGRTQRQGFVPFGAKNGIEKLTKFERIKVRVFNNDNAGGMDTDQGAPSLSSTATRLSRALGGIFKAASKRVKRNFNRIPIALIALLVGVALTAFFPHPESPGDAFITFTIVTLGEFLSSILYSEKNQGGFLRWAKYGESVPILLNAFKIGVFYGLFIDAFKVGS